MFRKPPSKFEQIQNTLSHTLETLQEALESLPVDRLKEARDSAAETLGHGFEAALHTAGEAVHMAAEALDGFASRAGTATAGAREAAAAAAHSAGDNAGEAAANVSENARAWASRAGRTASRIGDAASDAAGDYGARARDRAGSAAQAAQVAAQAAAEHAASAREFLSENIKRQRKAAARGAAEAQDTAQKMAADAASSARGRASDVTSAHVVVEDNTSRWLWIGVGLLAGAAIAVLLAPSSGRRSRALVKDKLAKARHHAGEFGDAAVGHVHDLKNRAAGIIQERQNAGASDDADDNTVADRVRTALGESPATRHLERLNVDCVHGVITLRGPVTDAALQAQIEEVVRGVKGVHEVRSELLLEEAEGDAPTFVG